MNTKIVIILSIVTFVTISTAKPLSKPLSKPSSPSQLHKLIKRSVNGEESTSKTGFAAVMATKGTDNKKKTRECEEWKKQEVTGQWKCIKFIVTPKN